MRVVSHQAKELQTPLPNFRCHPLINGLTPRYWGENNNLVRHYLCLQISQIIHKKLPQTVSNPRGTN